MTERKPLVFKFEDIVVRENEFAFTRAGETVNVEPTAFRVLLYLLRNPGRLVTKDEIMAAVWHDTAVSDNSLTRSIATLRRLLDDDSREPRYIATVQTLGYRFVSEVRGGEDGFGNQDAASATMQEDERESRQSSENNPLPPLTDGTRQDSSNRRLLVRKALFAGIAGVLLVFAGLFIVTRFRGAHSTSTPSAPNLATEQRLTANPPDVPVHDAVVSPDGKYVAYTDPTGLYLRQIPSGETRPVSLPKDFVAIPRSWYPDGIHLLVMRTPGERPGSTLQQPALYKLSILGGEPREVVSDVVFGYASADGTRIAYVPHANPDDLWIMDSDGSSPRRIVSSPEPKKGRLVLDLIFRVAWSPTGQQVAYIERHFASAPYPVESIKSLRIVDAAGGRSSVVLEDARLGDALWWAPDGRIFFSYREDPAGAQDNYGVYSIRFDERSRKAIGPPQPITGGEGRIEGLSGTADGKRLVLLRWSVPSQAFVSSYNTATRRWEEPRRLILDANENVAWAWSRDSKAAFFVSNRNGTWKLFKQAIDETTPEELVEGRSISCPRLSADGTQVLYLSSTHPGDRSFPVDLMSKPIAGGAPRSVIRGTGIANHQCATAPATLCVFSQFDGDESIFRAFDLKDGPGRELLRLPSELWIHNGNWSLSADGSKLALFLDQHRIRFFSIATGASQDVTVKDWPLRNGDWAANSQTVFMPSQSPDGNPVILEVDQAGRAKVALQGRPNVDFDFMIQSPDSRFALVGELTPSGNAWIVNDF